MVRRDEHMPMRRAWVVAVLAVACSDAREQWPDPRRHVARDAAPIDSPAVAIDAGVPLDPTGMVLVPAGEYLIGRTGEDAFGAPLQAVTLQGFYIDKTEVTVAAYGRCVAAGACTVPGVDDSCPAQSGNWGKPDRADHPVNCVSFAQALTYCNWLGKRLPANDEWEKAARGTDGRTYPWGEQTPSCKRAVIKGCTRGITAPVGSRPAGASPYGLLDMAGNVREIALSKNLLRYQMDRLPITVAGLEPIAENGAARGGDVDAHATDSAFKVWATENHGVADWVGFRCAASVPGVTGP
ncbi:MAG: SUMF1/EgtB/PvdO family nonheme iron enzyme [Myxococcales bacterium]|nr:SUMF1/EgtB/PvdO family nonheme iron enzyme [Myxococcales bacterium]